MIPAETIREMMKASTPGPWFVVVPKGSNGYARIMDTAHEHGTEIAVHYLNDIKPWDGKLLASAPDLAQTALELYARVEEMEKEREACLKFCREQNGQEGCKNCGLGTGENWSINTPNECPVDGSCEACQ